MRRHREYNLLRQRQHLDSRVVKGDGLKNRCIMLRGFESHSRQHIIIFSLLRERRHHLQKPKTLNTYHTQCNYSTKLKPTKPKSTTKSTKPNPDHINGDLGLSAYHFRTKHNIHYVVNKNSSEERSKSDHNCFLPFRHRTPSEERINKQVKLSFNIV